MEVHCYPSIQNFRNAHKTTEKKNWAKRNLNPIESNANFPQITFNKIFKGHQQSVSIRNTHPSQIPGNLLRLNMHTQNP